MAESLPGCRQPTRLFSSVQPKEPQFSRAMNCFNIGIYMIGNYFMAPGRIAMGADEPHHV